MKRLIVILGLLVALPAHAQVAPNTLKTTDFVNATVDLNIPSSHPRFGVFSGLRLRSYTTAQRDGIPAANKKPGEVVWNSTAGAAQVWDGSAWQAVAVGDEYTGDVTGHLTGGVTVTRDSTGNVVPNAPIAGYTTGIYMSGAAPAPDTSIFIDGSPYVMSRTGFEVYSIHGVGSTITSDITLNTTSSIVEFPSPDTVTGSLYLRTGSAATTAGTIYVQAGAALTGGSLYLDTLSSSDDTSTTGNIYIRAGQGGDGNGAALATGGLLLTTDSSITAAATSGGINVQCGDLTGAGAAPCSITMLPGHGPTGDDEGAFIVDVPARGQGRFYNTSAWTGGGIANLAPFLFTGSVAKADTPHVFMTPTQEGDLSGISAALLWLVPGTDLTGTKHRESAIIVADGRSGDAAGTGTTALRLLLGTASGGVEYAIKNDSSGFAYVLHSAGGVLSLGGPAVTVQNSSCGGGTPAVSGSNSRGRVTTGTGGPTACCVTFNPAFLVKPICNAQTDDATAYVTAKTEAVGSLCINLSAGYTQKTWTYSCQEGP